MTKTYEDLKIEISKLKAKIVKLNQAHFKEVAELKSKLQEQGDRE